MIQFKLKRIKGNKSVTHGILSIPELNFKCRTLELKDPAALRFMQNCAIPLGSYQLVRGYDQRCAMYPVFRYRVHGFVKKPSFTIEQSDVSHLECGNIALGTALIDDFTIKQTFEFQEAFRELMTRATASQDIMSLVIYKSILYEYEDISYQEVIRESYNFIEDEKQAELDND